MQSHLPQAPSSLVAKIIQTKTAKPNKEVAILAGHYCVAPQLSELSHEGEAEHFSFALGIAVYRALVKQSITARLILWVNDIGISSEQREQLKQQFALPQNYVSILQHAQIPVTTVEVIFESASRNKASTLLRQKIKQNPEGFQKLTSEDPDLVRCIDLDSCSIEVGKSVYAITGPEGLPLVMKEGSNPKCNLILATLFYRIAQSNPDLLFVNIFNDIYIERIRLGIFVAKQVYELPQPFINLFCDDDSYFEENFTEIKHKEEADVV
ncbi:hypothetical protein PSECIP111854_00599 [Pseudoalteromonas sp. CIP111854]|uniref:Uncharacterized protein n=1 Tax=Pseudoalteromonas holothuriae TaxID=2963714 RepID=A0A9W4QS40_9GAMM|nr:hypothetical protein [Pseudoalteromonas sp. CIP111854]CAH9050771.1 hypothetical protein PSECIP111854_00599 [Pseudoalteromonas sp. CIP111854]